MSSDDQYTFVGAHFAEGCSASWAPTDVLEDGYPILETHYPDQIGASQLHQEGITGAGVTIAFLDTGHDFIVNHQQAIPAPLNYRGFPKSICTSVNHQVCHGIPGNKTLKNGDIVEISTSPQQQPHHDWLNIVVTNRARSKIRSWLKREEKKRSVEVGRKLIEWRVAQTTAAIRAAIGP